MTSLIAWIAVDSRSPASIYLASDSRISWGNEPFWDYGRKLFASRNYPEILGYVGDVLFPSLVLGQLIDLIDADLLFNAKDLHVDKWLKILTTVQQAFESYPSQKARSFTIIYCTRENSDMASIFHISTLSWDPTKGWINSQKIDLPKKSGIINVFGSGAKTIKEWHSYWSKTESERTSRSVFSAFCDALKSGQDKGSGGSPQLVGIYRKDAAESFGIIYNNQRYLFGLPVEWSGNLSAVEWRNDLFERCDWQTMKPLEGAQRHSRPRSLEKA